MTQPLADGRVPPQKRRARVHELLERVLSSGLTGESVANGLLVPLSAIDSYRSGRQPIPLEVQLLLVALAIERAPQHARLARQLREQIKASIIYLRGDTVRHNDQPPRAGW